MSRGKFKRPVNAVNRKEQFSDTEVGITHPNVPGFFKISDNGDVEFWASEGCGMVFHAGNRSVTIVADTVKFLTKEQDGIRWNKLAFNYQADKFEEPTLVPFDNDEIQSIYRGVSDFLENSDG